MEKDKEILFLKKRVDDLERRVKNITNNNLPFISENEKSSLMINNVPIPGVESLVENVTSFICTLDNAGLYNDWNSLKGEKYVIKVFRYGFVEAKSSVLQLDKVLIIPETDGQKLRLIFSYDIVTDREKHIPCSKCINYLTCEKISRSEK